MRRSELNTKAMALGIDYKRFRNKALLIDEISRVQSFYNTTDPCTLEDIRDIDPKHRVDWTQDGHRFCADINSIKRMFENHDTILPWAIDFCSGVQASENPEAYRERFDMRNVPELVARVDAHRPKEEDGFEETPSFHTTFLQKIEELVGNDPYVYGIVINRLLRATKSQIYQRMCTSMLRLWYQMQLDDENAGMIRDTFYHFCYVVYSSTGFHVHNHQDHLEYLLHTFQRFNWIIGTPAQFILRTLLTDLE